uniref:G protein-coupled receptor kinase n=1 Tax=Chelonoidis abingdonii TaxID=106734 RepID=A0A8C0H3D2_CHEAB
MDIGGLETVVANSAYVSARGSTDAGAASASRDRKMRARLKLPHITQCEHLRGQPDLDFPSVCLRQPIGKRLFQQFLEEQETFAAAGGLWKSVEAYAAAEESDRPRAAQETLNHFFDSASKTFCAFLEEKAVARVKEDARHGRADLFQEAKGQLLQHLETRAWAGFKESLFFSRFLQFKWLEGQSVTEEWFLDFRVLGKGGFGEVCACQMRATGKMYANKRLNKKRLKKRNGYEGAIVEKRILAKVHSRFIVTLAYAFQTKLDLCLVMTLMNGGDLRGLKEGDGILGAGRGGSDWGAGRERGASGRGHPPIHPSAHPPAQVENKEVTRRILHDPVKYSEKFSAACRAACEGLMAKAPAGRLGFRDNQCAQLKGHPLFQKVNWGRLEAGNTLPPWTPWVLSVGFWEGSMGLSGIVASGGLGARTPVPSPSSGTGWGPVSEQRGLGSRTPGFSPGFWEGSGGPGGSEQGGLGARTPWVLSYLKCSV